MKDWAIDLSQLGKNDTVCGYCRELMKRDDPPEILYCYRGEMLCLTVNVKEASKLEPNPSGGFRLYSGLNRGKATLRSLKSSGGTNTPGNSETPRFEGVPK